MWPVCANAAPCAPPWLEHLRHQSRRPASRCRKWFHYGWNYEGPMADRFLGGAPFKRTPTHRLTLRRVTQFHFGEFIFFKDWIKGEKRLINPHWGGGREEERHTFNFFDIVWGQFQSAFSLHNGLRWQAGGQASTLSFQVLSSHWRSHFITILVWISGHSLMIEQIEQRFPRI